MKNILTLLLTFSITHIFAQNVPITFEANEQGADWTWTTFENDDNPPLEIVANPDKTGANTSETVAKFIARQDGAPFAGCESLHGADIGEYKIDATNSTITIMVYKTVISDVGIKLVTSTGWSKGELKVANTKINEWEELSFDFSTVDHENMTYDQIVIFPDFRDRSEETISYFDNFTIGGRTVSISPNRAKRTVKYLYPNPTSGRVVLDESVVKAELFAMNGEHIISILESEIDISHLPTGIYYLKAEDVDGNSITQRVVKR